MELFTCMAINFRRRCAVKIEWMWRIVEGNNVSFHFPPFQFHLDSQVPLQAIYVKCSKDSKFTKKEVTAHTLIDELMNAHKHNHWTPENENAITNFAYALVGAFLNRNIAFKNASLKKKILQQLLHSMQIMNYGKKTFG